MTKSPTFTWTFRLSALAAASLCISAATDVSFAADRVTQRINRSALQFPGCNDAVKEAVLNSSTSSLNYLVPEWRGLEPYEMSLIDGTDLVSGLETVVAKYLAGDGSRTATFAIGEKVFAIDVLSSNGSAYTVVDESGDGLFTGLVCKGELFDVPRWATR